ncbi:unnamed protein product [Cuscuta europaea]|uniref:Uncharacterized protein n=1 Tax=Cuscuta europaea TaxID=41803 RepID=A0A9P0ZI45_CUSEU|nr:unnamed protein product [Cuscuta europaea]
MKFWLKWLYWLILLIHEKIIFKIFVINKLNKKLYEKIAKMIIYSNFSQCIQKNNFNLTFYAYYKLQRKKSKVTCLVKKLADKPDKPKKMVTKWALGILVPQLLRNDDMMWKFL